MRRHELGSPFIFIAAVLALAVCFTGAEAHAKPDANAEGEALYRRLVSISRGRAKQAGLFGALRSRASGIDWSGGKAASFDGHVRRLEHQGKTLYLVRQEDGTVYVMAPPGGKPTGAYQDLESLSRYKLALKLKVTEALVDGKRYRFAHLTAPPQRKLLDQLFFLLIVILLFGVMVGMGVSLTPKDFRLVFTKPRGMMVGPICQFGLMPLIAVAIGYLFGFRESYPFIFVGLLLVASSPGGVTSNLMTFLGKGDVALSVSLTALSTVLSLLLTPLLLALYAGNIPDVSVPVGDVFKTILVLVIVPLIVGMLVRHKWPNSADRTKRFFSILGVATLLILIVVGILANLEKFADTNRYGAKFYLSVFLVTLMGMLFGGGLSKLLGVSNYQTRAIALETGLQNASLAMTLALLLQDRVGDFHSSMFFTSGIFGLWMYFAGAAMIGLYPKVLPIDEAKHGSAGA